MTLMSFSSESVALDNLLAGDVTSSVDGTVLSGEGTLVRGQIMGQVSRVAGAATADGGNTGDGVPGAVTLGVKAKIGTYTLTCVTAAANAGDFKVVDPDGYQIDGLLTVAVAYTSDHVNLTIADGAADFIVGDIFTIAVTAGSSPKWRAYNAVNIDGSQFPIAILGEDIDATAADAAPAVLYLGGQFKASGLTGYTAALQPALRDVGIIVKEG